MTKTYKYTIKEITSNGITSNRTVNKYQTLQGAKNWLKKQKDKENYKIIKEIS